MAGIHRLLIANRGEIVHRIARTCRTMGIESVAIFSDPDANAPFVRACDEAVRIGGSASADSYLCIDKIITAAKLSHADAIHPGFGFLSENPAFARACREAGLAFIGPTASVLDKMGSKIEARQLAESLSIPVIPGFHGDGGELAAAAEKIGFPLLLKASAGGGGKGMRVVETAAQLSTAMESASSEALAAFGSGTLLAEKYLAKARHIEVQILGDVHGNLVHLFERECSIQRRHQKIIEEAPAANLPTSMRDRVLAAAVKLGTAVGYVSAGTVEFLVDGDDFYFLEVNARLQVEHPVTEMITGVDLVREQIGIAEERELSLGREPIIARGHAIEARLYAEDPDNNFLPSPGTVLDWHCDGSDGLRIETGIETGAEISIHYDPMIAKIIAFGSDRAQATRRLRGALTKLSVLGPATNLNLLRGIVAHPSFEAANLHTNYLVEHAAELLGVATDPAVHVANSIAATLHAFAMRRNARTILPTLEPGYRNNRYRAESCCYEIDRSAVTVNYINLGDNHFSVKVNDQEFPVVLHTAEQRTLVLEIAGHVRNFRVIKAKGLVHVHSNQGQSRLRLEPRFPDYRAALDAGGLTAPMPGKIIRVVVAQGDMVSAGQTLVVLEAMKMEHQVTAMVSGMVADLRVAVGDQVDDGQVLAIVEPA